MSRRKASLLGKRIYEYRDSEGTVYYSFTRSASMVVPTHRLYLQSRLGDHILNFLSKMRHKGETLSRGTEDEEG